MAGYQRLSEPLEAIRDNWYQPACRFVLIIVACARNLFHPLDVLSSQLISPCVASLDPTIPVELLQLSYRSARSDYRKSNQPTFHAFHNFTRHQLSIVNFPFPIPLHQLFLYCNTLCQNSFILLGTLNLSIFIQTELKANNIGCSRTIRLSPTLTTLQNSIKLSGLG